MHKTQTSIPLAGFEPTIPAFKRAKTFHALDSAATVSDDNCLANQNISFRVWNPKCHFHIKKNRHWPLFWSRWMQYAPSHTISIRYILILCFHLRLYLPSDLFLFRSSDKNLICISTSCHSYYMSRPSHFFYLITLNFSVYYTPIMFDIL
jgi:hypothetical protein